MAHTSISIDAYGLDDVTVHRNGDTSVITYLRFRAGSGAFDLTGFTTGGARSMIVQLREALDEWSTLVDAIDAEKDAAEPQPVGV
jgi:hypothetical protein